MSEEKPLAYRGSKKQLDMKISTFCHSTGEEPGEGEAEGGLTTSGCRAGTLSQRQRQQHGIHSPLHTYTHLYVLPMNSVAFTSAGTPRATALPSREPPPPFPPTTLPTPPPRRNEASFSISSTYFLALKIVSKASRPGQQEGGEGIHKPVMTVQE